MKKVIILFSIVLLGALVSCNCGVKNGNKNLKTETDSLSNAVGMLMGREIRATVGTDLNEQVVYNAMQQVFSASDKELDSLDRHQIREAQDYFRNYMMFVLPAKRLEAGKKFLEETAKKKGVQKTESGLYYEIIEEGDMNAKAFSEKDTVVVNYVGTTTDGKEFDSSFGRGEPAEFPLDRVIKGWTEGMQLVGKGGKIKLYIPSELGYGSRGQLGNQVLIFDVDLIDVKPAAE